MEIRDERPQEAGAIGALVTAAFAGKAYSDGTEAALLAGLRDSGALVLSLVAAEPGGLLGQVAASEVRLGGRSGWVGIGPVAVRPDRQREGIGSGLMRAALARLAAAGFDGAVLVGDPGYYGRFGFAPREGLTSPGLPTHHVMGLGFGVTAPRGEIRWHPAFDTGRG
ncbi:GNAT family N-acetyltransferase [Vannielia litorea]|uniref:Putative acetyltransferase n=1 Tax=Vannielia litorea TaxID=1217970 RepID=A0A1N6EE10_9RHOB|nr:N-acetyltransferase [Vannielia litorea]SIN81127.1 putative acetyltransferase [Vannielia litorea]